MFNLTIKKYHLNEYLNGGEILELESKMVATLNAGLSFSDKDITISGNAKTIQKALNLTTEAMLNHQEA